MANDLQAVVPRILAQGVLALRNNCVMPRLVNRNLDEKAQERGQAVDVPIPSAVAVSDVAPSNTPPATPDSAPTFASVKLNQWKEAAFYLTDKEMKEAMDGFMPMQASEAISSISDTVDSYILSKYKGIYGFVGDPTKNPFDNEKTTDANQAAMVLNDQKAPKSDRRFVLNPAGEANALELRAFQDVSFNGANFGIVEGEINRKLGFDWHMDQNVPRHETGTFSGVAINKGAGQAVGDTVLTVDGATTAPVEGDIFTIAGDTQTYVIKQATTTSFTIAPGLKKAAADNAAITFKASHSVNLAFHRDAIAFCSRPLEGMGSQLGSIMESVVDPISGLAIRLEVSREHKRNRFSYDILYGAVLVRPELGCRVAGK